MQSSSTKSKAVSPLAFAFHLFAFYIGLSFLQRAGYVLWIYLANGVLAPGLSHVLVKGLLFDVAAGGFLFAPAILAAFVYPKRWLDRALGRFPLFALTLFPASLAAISAIGEIFFYEEFHARYNFIAVDYLIYTTEVVRNVLESYSVILLAAGIFLPALLLFLWLRNLIRRLDRQKMSGANRAFSAACAGVLALVMIFTNEARVLDGEQYWPRELSKNSIFALFAAFRNNSINYHEFYVAIDGQDAHKRARELLGGDFEQGPALVRRIKSAGPEKKLNVVLVAMESMSASFLGKFGNKQPLTPNLDKLADDGLFYTGMYATGTRTVRGLEALMLSLPPTPGQSILRRPNSDDMFNLGTPFRERNYVTQFVYGGNAFFDNMQEWFESNHFEVVDWSRFPSEEIQFRNAWGVCDEDLFAQALKQEEKIVRGGKNFFQVILTTSNHRPYTYPEGKIDMPPHNGREGAIKYSDYSIGTFIASARTKSWFKDTIFIFVADHDASVAGGTDIPVKDYLIPAIFYSPGNIPPEKVEKLVSQIDLGPTLLGILGFSYESRFFGEDVRLKSPARAYLGTYQKVARLVPHHLTILSPNRTIETQELDDNYAVTNSKVVSGKSADQLTEEEKNTVSIYQTASDLFVGGLFKYSGGKSNQDPKHAE